MLQVSPTLCIPDEELHWTYARSAGPGGQNVNKVNSKAILHWDVLNSPQLTEELRTRFMNRYRTRITTLGQVVVSSQRYRDQPKNVQDCLARLGEMLQSVLTVPKTRHSTRPTRGSVERRLVNKRAQSQRKALRKPPRRNGDD